nr:Structural maintenance of chromosomes protein 2 [Polyrhizophydium stewartii]
MYLEELVVDGFKSYATRTVISGWDPEFNAITGLNGSGKSNILDAICFVLGISTLSHVRAANLQDLVYKRGQAGINKASVTVIFNNLDKETSPPGYHDHDRITITRQESAGQCDLVVVGGRNKYLVNGVNKNQQDVANLFQSVQLNVNNPHFLIMQGKITKVLNMKPPEILAMIEEAAGTRMFEEHKDKAVKTMDKKDSRLADISNLLETEITPKLDKLREGKRALLEFQKIDVELHQLQRFVVAFDYMAAKACTADRVAHLEKMNAYLAEDVGELETRLRECIEEKKKNGGKSSELDAAVKALANDLVKVTTQHKLKLESLEDENKNHRSLRQSLVEKEAELASKCASTLARNEDQVADVRKLEELLQSLTTGLSSGDGKDSGYLDQLKAAKQKISEAATEAQQLKLRISHLNKELKDAIPKAQAAEKQNSGLMRELQANQDILKMLQEQLDAIVFDPSVEARLGEARRAEQEKLDEIDQAVRELESTMSGLQFSYSDPIPNFDRSKVKGLVAELVNIPKEHLDAAMALEVCAGGKLYNVVVESEVVGTQLLQNGRLKRRVTIIPLNKITAFRVQAERIATAKQLAPGKVDLALSLVGSDEELEVVMNYVFGSTLICKDPATAKLVTFDQGVKLRSVTLDGDTYDPSGQLSGGSRSASAGSLLQMQRLKELRHKRSAVAQNMARIEAELAQCLRTKEAVQGLKQSIDLKKHEKKSLDERLATNPAMQIIQRAKDLHDEISSLQSTLAECGERKAAAEKEAAHIEKEMREFSSNRESKLKSIKDQIASGKRAIAKAQPLVQAMQQDVDLAKEETAQLSRDAEQIELDIKAAEKQVEALQTEIKSMDAARSKAQAAYDEANARLQRERSAVASFDKKIESLEEEKRKKTQAIQDAKLELQTLKHEIAKLQTDQDHAHRLAAQLSDEHVWIQDQKHLFGQQGSEYDFDRHDIRERKKRLAQLGDSHSRMQKSIDPQVLEKFDRVEKKEASLTQRLATVHKDKKKIQQTIQTLDELKREKLVETWTKVNRDFGLIFGDLLPGNTCKLEPVEGGDITDGLEVKAAALSSLIALSLILSLLQFRPAPMYILDEVDSALDLSHTQNIGQLLKNRFKGSQFIVVSLKDGMFNNANVLFRTKFVDGVSKVDVGRPRTPKFLQTPRQNMLSEMNI